MQRKKNIRNQFIERRKKKLKNEKVIKTFSLNFVHISMNLFIMSSQTDDVSKRKENLLIINYFVDDDAETND